MIYLQQTTLSNNGMKVDVNFCKNPSEETNWCNFKAEIHPLHLVALVGNGFFVVLHLLQTRKYYDGLAYDVGENASQISVIFLVVTVLFMETSERGLFFGSPVVDFSSYSVAFVRKYHGYFFFHGRLHLHFGTIHANPLMVIWQAFFTVFVLCCKAHYHTHKCMYGDGGECALS